jgi:glycosyltransferase involved in cell wall biosynthesis
LKTLLIHQNFPGQFRHVASALGRRPGHRVVALTDSGNTQKLADVTVGRYKMPPMPTPAGGTRAGATLTNRFQRGEAVARALAELKRRGFIPDVILGHPGWGELMLVPEIFPESPLIAHAEYYYSAEGGDIGFDAEFPDVTDEIRIRLKARNLPLLVAMADCRVAIAPTNWQASRFPSDVMGKMRVIHEGIRSDIIEPNAAATFNHGTGDRSFRAGDEVITFVNRNLEPMRGFHILMRALPGILTARPDAHIVIVGGDGVSYGQAAPGGESWKARMLRDMDGQLPLERIHFVGQISYEAFIALMQISRLHIYATYPFVLSWSMLEAMSAGGLVLGSATPPVTEVIEHGRNGLLYDFFDVEGLVRSAVDALARPQLHANLRREARQTIVQRYDLERICLPEWLSQVDTIAGQAR